ncbi:MAG: hypothetical protein WBO94_03415, partial [Nitrospira sp.]
LLGWRLYLHPNLATFDLSWIPAAGYAMVAQGSAGDRGASRSNDQSGMILPQAHPPKSTVESLQVFR